MLFLCRYLLTIKEQQTKVAGQVYLHTVLELLDAFEA